VSESRSQVLWAFGFAGLDVFRRSTSSLAGRGPPATGGSPRQTPCLPFDAHGNRWQPTATDYKSYDNGPTHGGFEARDCHPIVPLKATPFVRRGEHGAPQCEHGTWTFAGADFKRKASKWRCPTGECAPKSRWVKADRRHPLIPHSSKRWGGLYWGRSAVEREFGRLKNEYGLTPLRVRGIERGRTSRRSDDARPPQLGSCQSAGDTARSLNSPHGAPNSPEMVVPARGFSHCCLCGRRTSSSNR
jgi:hypothetical protein